MKEMDAGLILVCIAVSAVIGALLGAFAVGSGLVPQSQQQMIAGFYETAHAATVSPSDYIDGLQQGNPIGVLVDLRTKGEYDASHLVGAVNIPAGQMTSGQLVAAFRQLPPNETIITYCYSSYCDLSDNVGLALSQNGIYAKHMTAGWYELNRDYSSYVVNGSSPGTLNASSAAPGTCSPTSGGQFGC